MKHNACMTGIVILWFVLNRCPTVSAYTTSLLMIKKKACCHVTIRQLRLFLLLMMQIHIDNMGVWDPFFSAQNQSQTWQTWCVSWKYILAKSTQFDIHTLYQHFFLPHREDSILYKLMEVWYLKFSIPRCFSLFRYCLHIWAFFTFIRNSLCSV